MIFTLSFDDGSIYDLKMLKLLNHYGFKATFYIPQNYLTEHLTAEEIKKISETQEIGAHALTHPDLTKIDLARARQEIAGSKKWLENIIQQEVKMFCYPRGKHNNKVIALTQATGFVGARTTKLGFCSLKNFKNNYCFPTTCLIFPPYAQLKKSPKKYFSLWHRKLNKLKDDWQKCGRLIFKSKFRWSDKENWLKIAQIYLAEALAQNGIFHLWGHTAEIEKYNLWLEVEGFFEYISKIPNLSYLTNSEVINKIKT